MQYDLIPNVKEELKTLYKKSFVDSITSHYGWQGILLLGLEDSQVHGQFVMPYTYAHRKEIINALKEYLNQEEKNLK